MGQVTYLFVLLFCILGSDGKRNFFQPKLSNDVQQYSYSTKYFRTNVDHFSFTTNATYDMKYLLNVDHWKYNGPIFFYCGNEAAVEVYAENTGFMWELAPILGAAVIFAEHRYYGSSMPFGNDSFKSPAYFGYMTAEQALADYAALLLDFKEQHKMFAPDPPVIAFGGSYGGMLAAWFRQKYPNVVAGSIAASAPIWLFPNMTDCHRYDQITTRSFAKIGSPVCVQNIRNTWNSIERLGKTGASGLDTINNLFNVCSNMTATDDFMAYLMDFLRSFVMVNYPYPTNFLGKLPAWPVKYFCQALDTPIDKKDDVQLITAFSKAMWSLTNYTGDATCLDWKGSSTPNIGVDGWNLQTCMEMTTPACSNGVTDMFPPQDWDENAYAEECVKNFGVKPRTSWMGIQYWAKRLASVTNVVYSNGGLDPWSGLGVLSPQDVPKSYTLFNPLGAHHLDLRGSDPSDDSTLKRIRMMEKKYIRKFIKEWHHDYEYRRRDF